MSSQSDDPSSNTSFSLSMDHDSDDRDFYDGSNSSHSSPSSVRKSSANKSIRGQDTSTVYNYSPTVGQRSNSGMFSIDRNSRGGLPSASPGDNNKRSSSQGISSKRPYGSIVGVFLSLCLLFGAVSYSQLFLRDAVATGGSYRLNIVTDIDIAHLTRQQDKQEDVLPIKQQTAKDGLSSSTPVSQEDQQEKPQEQLKQRLRKKNQNEQPSPPEKNDPERPKQQQFRQQKLRQQQRQQQQRTSSVTTTPNATNRDDHAVVHIRNEVLWRQNSTNLPRIPVVPWPLLELGIQTAEHQHIEKDGIQESPFLTLSTDIYNFDPNVVWVGDTGYPFQWREWCNLFLEKIQLARDKRLELGLAQVSWPIYIVDFTDGHTFQKCRNIEAMMGSEWVHYTKRSLANRRHWVSDRKWVTTGEPRTLFSNGKLYQHTPLIVRTDTINSLKQVLHDRGMTLADPIERIERTVDVTHLWPPDSKNVGKVNSQLRTTVSQYLVDEFGNNTTNITTHVGLAGAAIQKGRRGVQSAYIDALLNSKIVVIVQRDSWEDHYRLFEALVSGAMVLTDQMLGKPVDVVNGTALVEFTSLIDLRHKIEYYLEHTDERFQIARQGRLVAMRRHRSWHRMEEIIFGDVLSNCTTKHPNCPYIVHANEGRQ